MTRINGATLPLLEIPWPRCGHCGKDVQMEDGVAYCLDCKVVWGEFHDGIESEVDLDQTDGSKQMCRKPPAQRQRSYVYQGKLVTITYRLCILPRGHTSPCLHPEDYESAPVTVA